MPQRRFHPRLPTTRPLAPGSPLHRFPTVDLLRGLCIILVVLHHTNIRLHFDKSPPGILLPLMLNRVVFRSGSYCVKIFFVVSGFLISSSILGRWHRLADIDIRTFYRLRFARIGPCLLALLAILSFLHLAAAPGFTIKPERATLPRALLAALTFHVNWLEAKVSYLPGSWDILWSLSVEEAFYLFYPLLCRYIRKTWLLLIVAAALLLIGPFFRTILAPDEIASDYGYFANLDGIALGCVAAVMTRSLRLSTRTLLTARTTGWAFIAIVIVFRQIPYQLGLSKTGLDVTLLELGTALLLLAVGQMPPRSRAIGAPVRWFGRNSYEVYLTHMFVVTLGTQFYSAMHAPIDTAPFWFVGILSLAGLLGSLVSRWYSEPLNRALRKPRQVLAK
ncbi:MAG: acyltransferase [Acidobacteriota bacterium]|nr:acyltransferase [Acidobacteriota bacterium]